MKCPHCGSLDDRVTNNRPKKNHTVMRRRRECAECLCRWTTYELSADSLKKDNKDMINKFLGED